MDRDGNTLLVEGPLLKARMETVTTPSSLSLEYELLSPREPYQHVTKKDRRSANALEKRITRLVNEWERIARPEE